MALPAKSETAFTAAAFLQALGALAKGADNGKFFHGDDPGTRIMGVRMGSIFTLARQFSKMPLQEVDKLLDNVHFEARMGAVSIMDFQAREKKITPAQRKALYDLYTGRHDRINNWDMVDRSAPHVVGGYLNDKDKKPLYRMAKSKDPWERRTAIVATWFFIRNGQVDDTFRIAELLAHDKHELVNKAVGSWIREAGKRDKKQLLAFLEKYAATLPRVTLRYAVEKLGKAEKERFMKAANAG